MLTKNILGCEKAGYFKIKLLKKDLSNVLGQRSMV